MISNFLGYLTLFIAHILLLLSPGLIFKPPNSSHVLVLTAADRNQNISIHRFGNEKVKMDFH